MGGIYIFYLWNVGVEFVFLVFFTRSYTHFGRNLHAPIHTLCVTYEIHKLRQWCYYNTYLPTTIIRRFSVYGIVLRELSPRQSGTIIAPNELIKYNNVSVNCLVIMLHDRDMIPKIISMLYWYARKNVLK